MKINKEVISKLSPCKDRLDNYVKFYGDRDFTIKQFMGLKNITHSDKLWVAFRLMPRDKIRFLAADLAEMVLHLFEERYPDDLRPRRAIEAARAETVDVIAANATANAAYAAAYTADYAAAAAAYTAAYTANTAADYAYNAANAAYNAANAAAAYAAAYTAYTAAYAAYAAAYTALHKPIFEKRQRTLIIKHLKGVK